MSPRDVFMDFAIAGSLIFLSQLLRSRVKFFQNLFIPAGLIGGFLGLFMGAQGLNVLPFSEKIGSYAWILVVLVFAAVGMEGIKFSKTEGERIGSYFSYRFATMFIQFGVPVLFTILVLSKIDARVEPGFGILLASGFLGGPGTAAAVGSTFAKLGYTEAADLGMTFATAGILTGIFGGLAAIKWATRKGYTQYIKDVKYISDDLRTSMVKPENRVPIGENTVSSISIDPFCWHLAILLIPAGISILFCEWFDERYGIALPEFAIAFLLSIGITFLFKPMKLDGYIDSRIFDRISGTATDFIVFFGVASIKIAIIVEYAIPLALMLVLGIILVFYSLLHLGPLMNNESWFERCIFCYGYLTGVFANGFILLRIVDPENKSKTLSDTAITEPPNTVLELVMWAIGPYMLMNGQHWLFAIGTTVLFLAFVVLSRACGWWYKIPLSERKAVSADNITQ